MKTIPPVMFLMCLAVIAATQQPQQGPSNSPAGLASADKGSGSTKTIGNVEVLSDTQGVDFGPYLTNVVAAVRRNWYTFIPQEARAPEMKSGKVAIELVILSTGNVAGMKLASPSGDVALDRAAWGGVTKSLPFAPLPAKFTGPYLALRFRFYYNPKPGEVAGGDQNQRSTH